MSLTDVAQILRRINTPAPVSEKRCPQCGKAKPDSAFNNKGSRKQSWCRQCERAYKKARWMESRKR